VSGVCYGFIGNRMLARRTAEAERLLIEGPVRFRANRRLQRNFRGVPPPCGARILRE
jgi:3-hydroxyacyl-CoA dehydrogenase